MFSKPALIPLSRPRLWWNWQTRYLEVVVPQGVQVQVLLSAPSISARQNSDSGRFSLSCSPLMAMIKNPFRSSPLKCLLIYRTSLGSKPRPSNTSPPKSSLGLVSSMLLGRSRVERAVLFCQTRFPTQSMTDQASLSNE